VGLCRPGELRVLCAGGLHVVEAHDPALAPAVEAGAVARAVLRLVDLRSLLVGEDAGGRLPVLTEHADAGHGRRGQGVGVIVLTRKSVSPIEDLATRNCDRALKA